LVTDVVQSRRGWRGEILQPPSSRPEDVRADISQHVDLAVNSLC